MAIRGKLPVAILLALIPGLLGLAAARWPLTVALERRYGLDLLFKLRGPQPRPPGVVVVAIDDASYLERKLRAPWPRGLHGELVRVLKREGARAVAFDVLFDAPREPGEDDAARAGPVRGGQRRARLDRGADRRSELPRGPT